MFLYGLAITCVAALATAPTTSPAVDHSTPKQLMRSLSAAIEAEDSSSIAACFFNENDPQNTSGRAAARTFVAGHQYWKSVCARFGRETAIDAYRTRGIVLPDSHVEYPDAEWEINGDEVFNVYKKGGPHGFGPLKRVNGQWYVHMFRRSTAKDIAAYAQRQNQTAQQYETLTADVNAGKFNEVNAVIDVLYPREKRQAAPPQPPPQQTDATTIPGAMNALGLALQKQDSDAASKFYSCDGPDGPALIKAHVLRILAVERFVEAASRFRENHRIEYVYGWVDPVDDLFGNMITEWKIAGERATGTNDAGPAAAKLRRVNGIWTIDLTPGPDQPPARQQTDALEEQGAFIRDVTAAIQDRKLLTPDEVRAELKRRGIKPVEEQ
jgi:hypothetical protein